MLYTGKVHKVDLFKINTVENLRQKDMLSSLFLT